MFFLGMCPERHEVDVPTSVGKGVTTRPKAGLQDFVE